MMMRWRAEFACRSPPRLSRWRCCWPDEAVTGEVPHRAAKAAWFRRRWGLDPAVMRMSAATIGPIPGCWRSFGGAVWVIMCLTFPRFDGSSWFRSLLGWCIRDGR